jgi:4-aminobutyrate aminotransferase-like enzyme
MITGRSHASNVWAKTTDLQVISGHGCRVVDVDGNEYLDFTAGIAAASTGHCHPEVVQAIADQAARFIHAQQNVYTHDLIEPLAAKLDEITPPSIDTFFFANSGDEILETAVKVAKHATGRHNVVVFDGAFHGRTHLTRRCRPRARSIARAMGRSRRGSSWRRSPIRMRRIRKPRSAERCAASTGCCRHRSSPTRSPRS